MDLGGSKLNSVSIVGYHLMILEFIMDKIIQIEELSDTEWTDSF